MKQKQIAPANEILSAFLSAKLQNEKDVAELCDNPHAFLFAKTGIEIKENTDIIVIQNDDDTIHLTLPFYDGLQKHSVTALQDDDIEQVIGGELLVTVFLAITAVASVGILTVATAGAGSGVYLALKKGEEDK